MIDSFHSCACIGSSCLSVISITNTQPSSPLSGTLKSLFLGETQQRCFDGCWYTEIRYSAEKRELDKNLPPILGILKSQSQFQNDSSQGYTNSSPPTGDQKIFLGEKKNPQRKDILYYFKDPNINVFLVGISNIQIQWIKCFSNYTVKLLSG